jgi:SAM-dependent methyltransferase
MSNCTNKGEWFASWFDTHYYHLLYAHRSHDEAAAFIQKLVAYLAPAPNAAVLDLACGKGRHSIELAKYNLNVTGVDLSPCSIAEAKKHVQKNLHFEVQDMRTLALKPRFDIVFNLFTSFGYFDCDQDNALVLERVYEHLEPGGYFVLDYFNSHLIDSQDPVHDVIMRDSIQFQIKKWIDGSNVFKEIKVIDGSIEEVYQEKVQLLQKDTIATMLQNANFSIFACFGNYQLGEMQESVSPRCIFIAQKP